VNVDGSDERVRKIMDFCSLPLVRVVTLFESMDAFECRTCSRRGINRMDIRMKRLNRESKWRLLPAASVLFQFDAMFFLFSLPRDLSVYVAVCVVASDW